MKTQLSGDQIKQYDDQGFLYLPQLLSPDEVSELKTAVVDTVASMGRRKLADAESGWTDTDDYYSSVFTQRLNLWKINDTIKRYMQDPRLGQMLCKLTGVSAMRVWHDQALIKEPFANATAWHLDNPYWSFSSRNSISIWIALEDATPHNGCMYFIPGTHKMARWDNSGIGVNMADLFKVYPEMAQIDPVAVPMKAGDCSFHNGLAAHGAGANMTRGRRIAMTCGYMPDGSTFNGNKNIMPEKYFQSLKVGDVLNEDKLNPVVGRID